MILPREELCNRTLAIEFREDYFLVVRPLLSINCETDTTYTREKYIYSLALVVDKEEYLQSKKQPLYKQMVCKLAEFFRALEEKHHVIYHH